MMTDFYRESESHERAAELMQKVFSEMSLREDLG